MRLIVIWFLRWQKNINVFNAFWKIPCYQSPPFSPYAYLRTGLTMCIRRGSSRALLLHRKQLILAERIKMWRRLIHFVRLVYLPWDPLVLSEEVMLLEQEEVRNHPRTGHNVEYLQWWRRIIIIILLLSSVDSAGGTVLWL